MLKNLKNNNLLQFCLFCLQIVIFPYVYNFQFVTFYIVFGYRMILYTDCIVWSMFMCIVFP